MPEPDLPPTPAHDSRLRIVFIGPQGVRAGWRLLVFVALVAVLSGAAFLLQKTIVHSFGTDFSAANVIIGETFSFGIVLLATAIMGRFEHRRLADYGLPPRGNSGARQRELKTSHG